MFLLDSTSSMDEGKKRKKKKKKHCRSKKTGNPELKVTTGGGSQYPSLGTCWFHQGFQFKLRFSV